MFPNESINQLFSSGFFGCLLLVPRGPLLIEAGGPIHKLLPLNKQTLRVCFYTGNNLYSNSVVNFVIHFPKYISIAVIDNAVPAVLVCVYYCVSIMLINSHLL